MGDWEFLYEMHERGYSAEEIADAAGAGAAPWEWEYIDQPWLDAKLDADSSGAVLAEKLATPFRSKEGTQYGVSEHEEIFLGLVECAKRHFQNTGRYLQIWGELGEIYAEIKFGLRRHGAHEAGSDGTIAGKLVEVKTISPEKASDRVQVKSRGNFEQLLIVRIDHNFNFQGRLFERKELKGTDGKFLRCRLTSDTGNGQPVVEADASALRAQPPLVATLECNGMPTKPIERLLFVQGGLCFFCNAKLSKAEATVEHLVPSARGGSNADENCVACCKAMNSLLGSMSIKEKIRVVLNQKGNFKCPNGAGAKQPGPAPNIPAPAAATPSPEKPPGTTKALPKQTKASPAKPTDPVAVLVANLTARGKARPAKLETLSADIKSQKLGRNDAEVAALIEKLKAQGKIVVVGAKVTYKL